ncbi:MAG: SAM-dependent methyltransferase [Firmicutes bacterium]|nr:SAM-dependent methyltransferase [Bacillota bacterium]
MNRTPVLSERLKTIADLVIPGKPMADIGTDHGHLPMWCLEKEIVPFAVLSDINEGPLEKAKMRIERSNVPEDCWSLRHGSGLSVLQPGEAATVVIAGMGGELTSKLLAAEPEVTDSVERFVFQPRSRAGMLREWLWNNGWRIQEERLVSERRRLCQIFAAEKGFQKPYEYSDIPECTDPLMTAFLDRELVNINIVIDNLLRSKETADRSKTEALQRKAAVLEQRRDELWKNSSF